MSAHHPTLAAKFAAIGSALSPYPPSFDGDPWLYGASLASLMSIAMLCAVVAGWMVRDIWRDRFRDHPKSPRFLFRLMIAAVGCVGIIRCSPEVAFMTLYGEVTGATMGKILTARRIADTIALPNVALWQIILVLIYPHVMLALNTQAARSTNPLDILSIWPRLMRAALIVATILVIATALAIGKGTLGHHG